MTKLLSINIRRLSKHSLKAAKPELRGHPISLRGRGNKLIWHYLSDARIKRPCRFTRMQADRRDYEFLMRVSRDVWDDEV